MSTDTNPIEATVDPGRLPAERRSSGRKNRWIYPVGLFALTLLLWEVFSVVGNVGDYVLPRPSVVAVESVTNFGYYGKNLWVTIVETVLGLALGIIVAVALAFVMSYVPLIEQSLYPLLITSQAIPKIALAPLFIIWFGFGISSKILMAFLICFFPLVIDTLAGLKSVNHDYIRMVRSMGASEWDVARRIKVPSALPHFFAGLKVASAFAMVGAVVGEFMGASEGLGYVIVQSQSVLNMPGVFAAIAYLSVVGIILFYAVALIERLVIPWHVSVGGHE